MNSYRAGEMSLKDTRRHRRVLNKTWKYESRSVRCFCPLCKEEIVTKVKVCTFRIFMQKGTVFLQSSNEIDNCSFLNQKKVGTAAITSSLVMILAGGLFCIPCIWFGGPCIPCFCDDFKTTKHICPHCEQKICEVEPKKTMF